MEIQSQKQCKVGRSTYTFQHPEMDAQCCLETLKDKDSFQYKLTIVEKESNVRLLPGRWGFYRLSKEKIYSIDVDNFSMDFHPMFGFILKFKGKRITLE